MLPPESLYRDVCVLLLEVTFSFMTLYVANLIL